jgi:K+-transporting ATPase ATPase C chain
LLFAVGRPLFPRQAGGSLIERGGVVVGSALIAQPFDRPEYFQPRPSAAGNGYDGLASGGSNYGPTNQKLVDRVNADLKTARADNPGFTGPAPSDMLTTSASGLDPDISPATAEVQVARVAAARSASPDQIRQLVAQNTQGRQFGIFGEPRVNVLKLNLSLDQAVPLRK